MCILLCFEPTPPRVTISCHPMFGAAELRIRARQRPDVSGPTLGMWGNWNGPGILKPVPSQNPAARQRFIAAF